MSMRPRLVYRENSRTARATLRNLVLLKKKKKIPFTFSSTPPFFLLSIVLINWLIGVCVPYRIGGGQKITCESYSLLPQCGPKDQTQVVLLGGSWFYHLPSLAPGFFI
jgi:hypothetical protein